MRTPQEIIASLKHATYWSQPNIKYTETMNLLNELEASLFPTEEVVVEEPTVEVVEEVIIEEPTVEVVEEVVVEEPTVEEVVIPKKTTTRKK